MKTRLLFQEFVRGTEGLLEVIKTLLTAVNLSWGRILRLKIEEKIKDRGVEGFI